MADEKPVQSKPKRRVKNPETFRERALKAQDAASRPERKKRVRRAGGKLSKGAAPLKKRAHVKLPKPVAKVLDAVGKVAFPVYLRNSWQELKLVTWPSWKESRQLTFAVIIFAVLFGVVIALVDYGLGKIFKHILLK